MIDFINQLISGNHQAVKKFYFEYAPIIKTNIRYYFIRTHCRDDILNDLLCKLFANDCKVLRNFNNNTEADFIAYLKTITRNYCIDMYRKEKKYISEIIFVDDFCCYQLPTNEREQPDNIFENNEKQRLLKEAVKNLPQIYQRVIRLHLDNLTLIEIAHHLRLNPKTVGSQFLRAKALLKKYLISQI